MPKASKIPKASAKAGLSKLKIPKPKIPKYTSKILNANDKAGLTKLNVHKASNKQE